MEELLQAGALASAVNDDKVSPLSLAVQHGHGDITSCLLDAGVSFSTIPTQLVLHREEIAQSLFL